MRAITLQTDETLAQLRALPSLDAVMKDSRCQTLIKQFGKASLFDELQSQLKQLRHEIQHPEKSSGGFEQQSRDTLTSTIITRSNAALTGLFAPSLRAVTNLTGIILHTNLGRAPYPDDAIDAMISVSKGASNLEYNLRNGKRGRRDDHVEQWICKLTNAEAATTVNNNAAAVLLVLNTLAAKKEVIVSRGELIEIGGSFRMPSIMKKAGCKLREVGTTNRTHLADYQQAIGKKTAALMKVHTSNYEINGFSESISAATLSTLATDAKIPLIDDLGSGSLTDLTRFGLPAERTAAQAIAEGVDVITFSGDKLLGGPQCGIIAGRRELIERIDQNPMKRAMRLDKITLAALEAVLKLYANPDQLAHKIPALRILSRKPAHINESALQLQQLLTDLLPLSVTTSIVPCQSQIGSGALPTKTLDSYAVMLTPDATLSTEKLASALRSIPEPVIGRIKNNALLLDCRALEQPQQLYPSLKQLRGLLSGR